MPGPWRRLDLLVVALPVAVAAELLDAPAAVLFLVAALAVVPLAAIVGRATELLAERAGGSIGALLNATFGNMAELVIAAALVFKGEIAVLKASLTGSIIGNLLLLLGVSMVVSGHDKGMLRITRTSRVQATMLFLAIGIFLLPTVFSFRPESSPARIDEVSDIVALVLFAVYALSLLFMFRTHRSFFHMPGGNEPHPADAARESTDTGSWSPKVAVIVLAVATALVAVAAEIVAGSVQEAGKSLGLHGLFLGLIVLPLVGNAAEQFSALSLAAKDRLDVAVDIAMGASMQIVMLVVPVLVLVGLLTGHHVTLVFSIVELVALTVSTLLVHQVVDDGEANWLEGVMLLALYVVVGAAAFFLEV